MSFEHLRSETFSPAEAAEILGVPTNTVKTWLARVPKIFTPEREPGEWRRLTADTLLVMRIMSRLVSNHGLTIESAASVVDKALFLRHKPDNVVEGVRISLFDDEPLELTVDLGPHGEVIEQHLSGANKWGDRDVMVQFHNTRDCESRITLKLNPARNEVGTRATEFINKRGE
jgi:hypothetical protein